MPLFPVEAKEGKEPTRDQGEWAKVGQSYTNDERIPSLGGETVSLPKKSPKQESDGHAKRHSGRKRRAADFFGIEEDSRAKKRSLSPSDDTDSGREAKTRHQKSGHKRSTKDKSRVKGRSRATGKSSKSGRHRKVQSRSEDSSDEDSSPRRSKSVDSRGQQLFVEDRRGDRDNLLFGGFYRLDVPLYDGAGSTPRIKQSRKNGGSRKAARTKEFNVLTRENPDCEEVWLRFVDFQEEAVRALHGGGLNWQSTSAAMVRMTLEKRAAILEGALRRNPSSIRLLTTNLHLADQLQEHAVVDSLWRGAIERSSHSCTLWLRYLHFKASHFASFSVPSQRSIYTRSIRALESKRESITKAEEQELRAKGVVIMTDRSMLGDSKEKVDAERKLLDVLWSYCMMEEAAGYHERALGVLQAMVELNIRSSSNVVPMDTFVSYWDSETPRIGDAHPSQAGLSRWMQTANTTSAMRPGSMFQPGEESVGARKVQLARPAASTGRRKRASDFFKEELPTTSGKQPKANSCTEVLEKAYHAAMALTTVPVRHTEPSSSAEQHGKDDRLDGADFRPLRKSGSSPKRLSESESLRTEPASGEGSVDKMMGADAAEGLADGAQHGERSRAVEAEGLIWVDPSQRTAYSVRHGYRIDVQGAQDSVSGLEYGRILSQIRGGSAAYEHGNRDVEAAAVASRRLRSQGALERDAEIAKQAAVLNRVPEGDVFSVWAKTEDDMSRDQWQPLRSTQDPAKADEQPDRVVVVEDLRPFLFSLSQPASLRTLVGFLLSVGGLIHPRSNVSHSPKLMSEACCAGSFGDAGLSGSLLSAVTNGLQAVWRASNADLPVSGKGVTECTGRSGSGLPPLVVSTAADQFLLLSDEVVHDPSRQTFLRNLLHHLVRAPESLPTVATKSSTNARGAHGGDMLVQLQCTLIMFEGYLAATAGARHGRFSAGKTRKQTESSQNATAWSDEDIHGYEARKVAKSLLEASQASATDLRLWSSYVQLLALLGSTQEAKKVAEKALSMTQALPEDKKPLAAELFWLTFRLHAGLPLSPRDSHAGVDLSAGESDIVRQLFEHSETQSRGNREMALLILCSFAEGGFTRSKSKKSTREGKGTASGAAVMTPTRLVTARKMMGDRVAQTAVEELQGHSSPSRPEGALDMTPPFMYYSVAWVWLEYLTRGLFAAEDAMSKCLDLIQPQSSTIGGEGAGLLPEYSGRICSGGTLAGNKPYSWNVVPEHAALGVCLERMHRGFSELLVLAQRYNPVETGPRRVREVLLRGLQSFPAEPGMLCMLLDAEQFSSSQQRLVHHLSEVSRRRVLAWEQGPTPLEWILSVTHQVMQCVREVRQNTVLAAEIEKVGGAGPPYQYPDDGALCVKNWLPGSYSRLTRSMESAISHPTGRGIPVLWRMYTSLEAMRGNHTQAKRLFWRAIHACPGNKSLWMDALRGNQRARIGAAGLRPAFRRKELLEVMDAMLEKTLHLRAEPP
eukprot:g17707.t2